MTTITVTDVANKYLQVSIQIPDKEIEVEWHSTFRDLKMNYTRNNVKCP
jgi:hypothetical protein